MTFTTPIERRQLGSTGPVVFPIGLGCMAMSGMYGPAGRDIIPLVGSRTRAQLTDALGALQVRLTPDELALIEQAISPSEVAGTRYDERQMQMLDSER